MIRRRTFLTAVLAAVPVAATTPAVAGPPGGGPTHPRGDRLTGGDRRQLQAFAADTWRSFEAMVDDRTGLPADNVDGALSAGSRSEYTSPTNIGAYLWSTVVARDARIIHRREARQRMAQALDTLATLERHDDSGMFYNWYSESTGQKLTVWPVDGSTVYPFLSSVDNGWLATALQVVASAEPGLRRDADALRRSMDFGFYYDPDALGADAPAGQIRGGFWDEPPASGTPTVLGNYSGRGEDVYYTGHHYGAFNTEPRIASYLGIAEGQIPVEHYYGTWRTFPNEGCDYDWTEQRADGEWTEYMGVPVFEGSYSYRDMRLVPTWGGSMFEALMVPLFVPEEEWGPRSWGINHPLTVQAQIEHGMDEAGYGYWGFSPSSDPAGGYREYGVDAIGMEPTGYTSDQERTTVDYGYGDCRSAAPPPTAYGDGVVTPHASFLAMRYAPRAAMDNLANLRADFDAYGPGGFYDAIAVGSGAVAKRYLSLDQGMVMAALGNELREDSVRRYFSTQDVRAALRPLMAAEEFNASPRP